MTLLSRLFSRPQQHPRKFRSILRVEELGIRAMPDGNDPPLPSGSTDPGITTNQTAPVIDDFGAVEISKGWFRLEGHVSAANPGGLTIYFNGIPAVTDLTTTTDADGNFSVVIQVKTDGTDSGTITAQTVDANGNWSNVAMTLISPTP